MFSFTTAPLPGEYIDGKPFVISVVGDLGQTQYSEQTRDHILQDTESSFTVIIGLEALSMF